MGTDVLFLWTMFSYVCQFALLVGSGLIKRNKGPRKGKQVKKMREESRREKRSNGQRRKEGKKRKGNAKKEKMISQDNQEAKKIKKKAKRSCLGARLRQSLDPGTQPPQDSWPWLHCESKLGQRKGKTEVWNSLDVFALLFLLSFSSSPWLLFFMLLPFHPLWDCTSRFAR